MCLSSKFKFGIIGLLLIIGIMFTTCDALGGDPTYTIIFNAGNGRSESATFRLGYSNALGKTVFERVGHTFDGWSTTPDGSSVVTREDVNRLITRVGQTVTLYAIWLPHTYRVFYDPGEGLGKRTPDGRTFTFGEPKILKSIEYLGFTHPEYIFHGWARDPDSDRWELGDGDGALNLTANELKMRLYALWGPNSLNITYVVEPGEFFISPTPEQTSIELGSSVMLPTTAERLGYGLLGWSENPPEANSYIHSLNERFTTRRIQDFNLYAVWEPSSGDVTPQSVTVNPNEDVIVFRGSTQQFTAIVHPFGSPQNVDWDVRTLGGSGLGDFDITPQGILTVGPDAPNALMVTATVRGTNRNSLPVGVTIVVPEITIEEQPATATNVVFGDIRGSLNVTANVTGGAELSYQWFSTTNINVGGTEIIGATEASFTIPTGLEKGRHYFFVEVSATDAVPEVSNVATVIVSLIEMVRVEGGRFVLGENLGTGGGEDVTPISTVTLTQGFWMGKFPITQGQWYDVMENLPSFFTGTNNSNNQTITPSFNRRDLPVEQVSWYDVIVFANRLSGLAPSKYTKLSNHVA